MKNTVRNTLRKKRSQLSLELQRSKSEKIISLVKQNKAFIDATNIGFYHSVRGEADPAELRNLETPQNHHKRFYLPVLSPDKNQGLLFGEVTSQTQFKNNKFDIPEPVFNKNNLVEGKSLDLVLVPLLGFDNKGNRLGMGGGYYDRCFAFKKHTKTKPILMGFAYDFQEIDSLNPEAWDVGLDMVATESRLITIS